MDREMKALLILIIATLGGASMAVYAGAALSKGMAAVIAHEPAAILLTGGLLLGLGAALRGFWTEERHAE
jgi:hypothetical protein